MLRDAAFAFDNDAIPACGTQSSSETTQQKTPVESTTGAETVVFDRSGLDHLDDSDDEAFGEADDWHPYAQVIAAIGFPNDQL
jgi:hypothetical protein